MKNTIRITAVVLFTFATNASPCIAQTGKKTMESSLHASGGDAAAANKSRGALGAGNNKSTPDKARGAGASKTRGGGNVHNAQNATERKKARDIVKERGEK